MTTRFIAPALPPMTAAHPRRTPRALMAALQRVAGIIHSRRALRDLDERLLNDIGMTREAAQSEAARAPWDVTWLPPRGPRRRHGETPRPTPGQRIAQTGIATRDWLAAAWQRYRSRQHIAHLDAAILKDIGVTYAEAEHEANRPFWR